MNILLIGTQDITEDTEGYYKQYLSFFNKAISYSGKPHSIVHALLDDLVVTVGDGEFTVHDVRNQALLKEYDLVLIRGHVGEYLDLVKVVSMYLKRHDTIVINDYSSVRSSSKIVQAAQFQELNLPVAKSLFVTPAVVNDPRGTIPFDFPCIMKDSYGSHGNHNYLVNDADKIREIFFQNPERQFILQRYIPNDRDYRLLLAGSESLIIQRKAQAGSHLNNTSQGGKAELLPMSDLPPAVIDQARQIVAHLGMTIAGVDVLFDSQTGEHYFLEVNSQPQLMTGVFLDDKAKLIGKYFSDISG